MKFTTDNLGEYVIDISPCFTVIFTMGNNFYGFVFASLYDVVIPKQGLLLNSKKLTKCMSAKILII